MKKLLSLVLRNARVIVAGLTALVVLSVMATPLFAAIYIPDSGPFIDRVDVYHHCLETDDQLVFVWYRAPYADPPDDPISVTFLGRYMNGAVELGQTTPYSYYTNGYGYGAFAIYLSASDAPAWGGSYDVVFTGSPTLEWWSSANAVMPAPSVTTATLNWRNTAGAAATSALMYVHIIQYAELLGDYWNIALVTPTGEGNRLSSYGEAYFSNVVPGLRAMCPSLFQAGVSTPQYEDVTYQKSQSEATKATWPFDWGGMSTWLGLPSGDEVFRTLIGFVIIFVICAVILATSKRTDLALLAGFVLLIVAAVPGWMSAVIVGAFVFVMLLLTGLVFILGKTS